jgi:hypothetical protein
MAYWQDLIPRDLIKVRFSDREMRYLPAHIGKCDGYGCFHPGHYKWAAYLRPINERLGKLNATVNH